MTHMRQMADSEGDFGGWTDDPTPCRQMVPVGTSEPVMSTSHLRDEGTVYLACGAAVQWRKWESSDGAYEDYQFKCSKGHVWWIESADA
jgi:hypothetical protein